MGIVIHPAVTACQALFFWQKIDKDINILWPQAIFLLLLTCSHIDNNRFGIRASLQNQGKLENGGEADNDRVHHHGI
ncbi:hypothetical protein [Oceanisphaera sp. KMM 10153]|uniref:hypothetical protein n=1 Tax=Oceanisphaera submarina TaxID=3390193 RepID=UPI0039764549